MDLATSYPVFLFLGWLHAVVANVEPPTNVILDCHNLQNILKWQYDQLLPELRFKVDIRYQTGDPDVLWVDPPALQADLSFLSDPRNAYWLGVTAVIGQNESVLAPEDGIMFSYFKDSPEGLKCSVDFPAVNLTAQQDGTVLLRFTHPGLVYKLPSSQNTKPRKKKSHAAQTSQQLPVFLYDIMIINQRHLQSDCVESVCEEKLSVDASQKKHCLKIKGEVEKIAVKATQEYCVLPLEEKPSYLVHFCVMGTLLAVSAVAFVLFMVFRKKTTPSTSTPNSITFAGRVKQWTAGTVQETVFVPEVGPTSPTPLLTEEEEFTPAAPAPTDPVLRLPIGVSPEDEGASDDVEEVRTDEGSGYMPGRHLAEDEEVEFSEAHCGYERRPVLVELAPDEVAEGYRS